MIPLKRTHFAARWSTPAPAACAVLHRSAHSAVGSTFASPVPSPGGPSCRSSPGLSSLSSEAPGTLEPAATQEAAAPAGRPARKRTASAKGGDAVISFRRGEKVLERGAATVGRPLGKGGIGVVREGRLYGQEVALKCAGKLSPASDRWLLKHERDMYEKLRDLQGDVLPTVVECGQWMVGVFCLATTVVRGTHPSPDNLASPEQRVQAVKALEAIHARGVLHGSVHEGNVMFQEGTGKVMFIDLGRSFCGPTPAECEAEVEQLHEVLSGSLERGGWLDPSPRFAPGDRLVPPGEPPALYMLGYKVVDDDDVCFTTTDNGWGVRNGRMYGRDVVIKPGGHGKYRVTQWEVKHEAAMYEALRELQGDVLPEVVECARLGSVGGRLCLVTALVRGTHPGPDNVATPAQRRQATKKLRMLHARGVAHGDLYARGVTHGHLQYRHIIFEEGSGKVMFMGLGSSYRNPTPVECRSELQTLESILAGGEPS